jgi:hypothetical protein
MAGHTLSDSFEQSAVGQKAQRPIFCYPLRSSPRLFFFTASGVTKNHPVWHWSECLAKMIATQLTEENHQEVTFNKALSDQRIGRYYKVV